LWSGVHPAVEAFMWGFFEVEDPLLLLFGQRAEWIQQMFLFQLLNPLLLELLVKLFSHWLVGIDGKQHAGLDSRIWIVSAPVCAYLVQYLFGFNAVLLGVTTSELIRKLRKVRRQDEQLSWSLQFFQLQRGGLKVGHLPNPTVFIRTLRKLRTRASL